MVTHMVKIQKFPNSPEDDLKLPTGAKVFRITREVCKAVEQNLIQLIEQESGPQTIVLVINSRGGEAKVGIRIFDYLTKARVDKGLDLYTIGDDYIYSAAIPVFCAGQHRFCHSRSLFLLHEARIYPFLEQEEGFTVDKINTFLLKMLNDALRDLPEDNRRFIQIISSTTSKSEERIEAILKEDAVKPAWFAKDLGLVESITDPLGIKLRLPGLNNAFELGNPQVINRGRGPELAGTRFTAFDIIPFLNDDCDADADYVAACLGLKAMQVQALDQLYSRS